MKKKIWIAVIAALLLIPGIMVYAADDTDLMQSSITEVESGDDYGFTVDLTKIPETYTSYTLSLAVSPEPSYLTIDEAVSVTYNAVQKSYQINSADLAGLTTLHLSAYLSNDVVLNTTYTVTAVALSDAGESITDELTFTVIAAEDDDSTGEEGGATGEEGNATGEDMIGSDTAGTSGSSANTSTTTGSSSSDTVTYQGSYDNYLESLAVTDYDFQTDYTKTNDTYFITVPNEVTEITVSATASDDDATVVTTGDDDLAIGVNKVLVSVTAENGNVRTYRIYVTREDAA